MLVKVISSLTIFLTVKKSVISLLYLYVNYVYFLIGSIVLWGLV